jgi:NAD(P)H-hydrate repair Nnr-like enzyme with NAD(P)H-hydrate dehydratase domain
VPVLNKEAWIAKRIGEIVVYKGNNYKITEKKGEDYV